VTTIPGEREQEWVAGVQRELDQLQADVTNLAAQIRAHLGEPPAKPRPPAVAGGPSLPKPQRAAAYIVFLQRTLNDHLIALGSPAILAVDGKWGARTQLAFERVCRTLGVEPVRNLRTFRVLAGALAPLTDAEKQRAATEGKAFEQKLRQKFAQQPPPEKKPDKKPDKPHKPAGDDRLAAAIRAHGGRYEAEIIAASRATGVPVAVICAFCEMESGFTNVFGHDGPPVTRNPVRSVHGQPNLAVTKDRYLKYKDFRRRGFGQQGVGPMQLTTASFQDRADALGGAWVPAHNIRIGAEVVREKIAGPGRGQLRAGLAAYNGSGPQAEAYADTMLKVIAKWQGHLGAGDAPTSFDVRAFQRLLNRRYKNWKVAKRVAEDGVFGPETRAAAQEIAAGMGIAKADFARGFTPQVRRVMAHPARRTDKQKARAAGRGAYRARLRAKYKAPPHASVSSLLGSHRRPKSAALLKVIAEAAKFGLVVTATTDGQHAPTSFHYSGHAVDFGVVGSLAGTPEHMRRLKAFQLAMFKQAPHLLELFGPIADHAVKNGRQTTISGPLLQQHLNHVHVAAT
jgi:hypothetical protein